MTKKILVTGATSSIGRHLLNLLTDKNIKAASRTPDKQPQLQGVEWVNFDLYKPETYSNALKDVDILIFMPVTGDSEPEITGIPLIEEAKKAGVRQIIHISTFVAEMVIERGYHGFRAMEEYIMASGMDYTILRPVFFMTNFLTNYEIDKIYLPFSCGVNISLIDSSDIAEVVLATITEEKHRGQTYTLTSGQVANMNEYGKTISNISGCQFQCISITYEDIRTQMANESSSPSVVNFMIVVCELMEQGLFNLISPDVSKILEREPISLKQFVEKNIDIWKKD